MWISHTAFTFTLYTLFLNVIYSMSSSSSSFFFFFFTIWHNGFFLLFFSACTLECQQKGSTDTDFKLELFFFFFLTVKHTKHETSDQKPDSSRTRWRQHSIGLPWLLQVRAMYPTVRHKNTCSGFKKINTFFFFSFFLKSQRHPKNTQRTVTPLSIQRVKQRVYYTRRIVGTGWRLAASQRLCRFRDMSQASCRLPVLCRRLFFRAAFYPLLFPCLVLKTGCWNHSVDRRFLVLFRVLIANPIWLFWGTRGVATVQT